MAGARVRRWRLQVTLSRDGRLHLLAAFVACLLVPAYSRAAGDGGLSWTMFSRSDSFRVDVRAFDRDDAEHLLHPIELGKDVDPALRSFLREADRFSAWPVGSTLERRLTELAHNGCKAGPYSRIDVTLERKASLDAPVHRVRARVLCPGR